MGIKRILQMHRCITSSGPAISEIIGEVSLPEKKPQQL